MATILTEKVVKNRLKRNWRIKNLSFRILCDWNYDNSIIQNKQFCVVCHSSNKTLGIFIVKNNRMKDITI